MAIHTSANTYRRGIPNSYNNFFFVAQTNNSIPVPMSVYLNINNYTFYNRNKINQTRNRWPWRI